MDKRLKELARLWCKWNRHELLGDDFALAVGELYKEETLEIWNDPLEELVI